MRRLGAVLAMAGLAGGWTAPAPASAAWSISGAGPGAAAATTMPAGRAPDAVLTSGTASVIWAAADLGDGVPVAGYVVRRYSAATGSAATVGGTCSGVVTTTSCRETLPPGSWVYTDTPVQLSWTGLESPASPPVNGPLP